MTGLEAVVPAVTVAGAPGLSMASTLALGLLLAVVLRAGVVQRRASRAAAAVEGCLGEVIDLLVLATGAGLPVLRAVEVVADRAPEPARPALAEVCRLLQVGAGADRALAHLGAAWGPVADPLVRALHDGLHRGTPVARELEEVARSSDERRRRAAEAAARRLSVSLLFPLAGCTLPAAVVLAVVPAVVAAIAGLSG